ncbi:inositol hexakisphosphate kinase 1-like [Littorina saxatilis]|uniref:inositol hexakisphosphate kinase 1-like n=1 Tax=Littorina saxatilis TaxID=31220 RepID=UPI0038B61588
MRLQERVGPKLGSNPVPLEPFGHQVAGQASMLAVDTTTVCKPLIPREHHLYRTLPPQLLPFTPQYKGVLYVQLEEEEDGHLRLWGYRPETSDDNSTAQEASTKGTPVPAPSMEEQENGREDNGREEDRDLNPLDWSSGASTPVSSGSELDMPSAVEAEQTGQPSRPSTGCIVRVKQDGEYEVKAGGTTDNRFLMASDNDAKTQAEAVTQPLNPWGLNLHRRLLDKMRKSSMPSAAGCPFLTLENVVARFTRPCILDLKVGSRLHGDDASQKKIASQSHKCNITTSRTLGLRLCGMQVYQDTTGAYKSLDKYYGRTLTEETFYHVLRDFLHNGQELRVELLGPILARLNALLTCLKKLKSFRFYASSLLIMYDGLSPSREHNSVSEKDTSKTKDSDANKMVRESRTEQGAQTQSKLAKVKGDSLLSETSYSPSQASSTDTVVPSSSSQASTSTITDSSPRRDNGPSCQFSVNGNAVSEAVVDVRMIDFAHTTHRGFHDDAIQHEGPDRDYLWGLQNLIDLFSQLKAEYS